MKVNKGIIKGNNSSLRDQAERIIAANDFNKLCKIIGSSAEKLEEIKIERDKKVNAWELHFKRLEKMPGNSIHEKEAFLNLIYSRIVESKKIYRSLSAPSSFLNHKLFAELWGLAEVVYVNANFETLEELQRGAKKSKSFDSRSRKKSEEAKAITKMRFTKLESELLDFCNKNGIKVTDSRGKILRELITKGFCDSKGNKKVSPATVSRMKNKFRLKMSTL